MVNRFDKGQYINMDWLVDAAVEEGRYRLVDLWSGEELEEIVAGANGGQYRGYLEPHDNWSFRLNPL